MEMHRAMRFSLHVCLLVVLLLSMAGPLAGQDPGVTVRSTTWQQDSPSICNGCVYRTGQNLGETKIVYNTLSTSTFGQFCSSNVDGQIYGEPLVVNNVAFGSYTGTVVYVVTQNDSVYAFKGSPPAPTGYPAPQCTLLAGPVSLLGSGETVVNCANLGGGGCRTIAQVAGIVSTPVIQITSTSPTTTGNLYAVAESQSGTSYIHLVWSLDITSLSRTTAISNQVSVPTSCPIGTGGAFSTTHIQRPALLLGGDNYLYVAFSMMDGLTNPLPNGMILAYNASPFSATEAPLCLATSAGKSLLDGAGIWQGGAGPAYGPDDTDTINFVYFNTGNGIFDANTGGSDYGDSFIKMTTAGSGALTVGAYFTPADQLARSENKTLCGTDDIDYGSGGVMLIPEENIKWPFLAVSGDKEGGIWFVNRTVPNGYGGDGTCSGTANGGTEKNVQIFPINGSGTSYNGPEIHNNPAFWESMGTEQTATNYLFMSSLKGTASGSGELMRYQICEAGNPIHNSTSPVCTTTGAYAYEVSGTPLKFPYGVTPTISAHSTSESDAIVWAIMSDGSVVPNQNGFSYGGHSFGPATNGVLYAFDAANPSDANMGKLYSSNDCKDTSGHLLDQINPATKFSVPTVANGYVYLGTQAALCTDPNNLFPNNSCYNGGTLYIFSSFSPARTCH
ncbi:MAG TPA: hypothetical protein VGS27_06335 [Candidatus Sulfotelmatobacter sp.]|nr:hypothetical protein [Candidatus Sulfotelmatobacter sp.]